MATYEALSWYKLNDTMSHWNMSREVELTIDIDVAPRHQGDDDVQHRMDSTYDTAPTN